MRRGAALLAVGLLAVAVVRRRLVVVSVVGVSMVPTYGPGERVLVRRAPAHALRRGQVVVFEEPGRAGEWMIKRVAAVGGDPVPHEMAGRSEAAASTASAVPAGRLAVLGDNPNGSYDSREIGYVPGDRVLGVVVRRMAGPGGRR
jgi:signal peptidase I